MLGTMEEYITWKAYLEIRNEDETIDKEIKLRRCTKDDITTKFY